MIDANQPNTEEQSTSTTEVPVPGFSKSLLHLEFLYRHDWVVSEVISELQDCLQKLGADPTQLNAVLSLSRILKEESDPAVCDHVFDLIAQTYPGDSEYPADLWLADSGTPVLLELLDVVVPFKRMDDIPRLIGMLMWDLFQIPSHILMLVRKHDWDEFWNTANARFDIRGEYDPMIRAQWAMCSEAFGGVRAESPLPTEVRKELRALRDSQNANAQPVLYVEGKTDRMILEVAYEKLYGGQPRPFHIRECDVVGDDQGGAGGAHVLGLLISGIRPDSPHAALALFDNDKEGIDVYNKLPAYFVDRHEPKYHPGKVSRGGRAAALLLPVPAGREAYAKLLNLPIEFMFSDEDLAKRTHDERGLDLKFPDLEIRVRRHGNPIIETRKSDLVETREVIGGKLVFATEIVPLLPSESFKAFEKLFWIVQDILLTELRPRRTRAIAA
ncbi:hypothetical protein [Paraburkholderia dilworthii]|uniref:hypothetical protein n=1 Tax=Paraburkholderia dilworthii TaxID=948106 RepID=UPI0004118DF7|nr:hypothetical protein [Paraburkholderia dilworthii]